ncbi:MAG: riboflavin synthase [Deltaproteobacteria bacterium]|nr:riboflavin synthase [Deltaproteobacteria bacterium]
MFTGIIEDVGRVHEWQLKRGSGILTLHTRLPSREIGPGSSVAVNGACLTVVKRAKGRFTVEVSPETLKRTSLSSLKAGDPVNLELPLRFHGRLGGHLVTGHIDGVAVTDEIRKRGKFTFFRFRIPGALAPFLVPKGSVALDGISLTVNECGKRYFSVAIIPFTLRHTNLRERRVDDKVNVEVDIIGKYVQSLARFHHRRSAPRHS